MMRLMDNQRHGSLVPLLLRITRPQLSFVAPPTWAGLPSSVHGLPTHVAAIVEIKEAIMLSPKGWLVRL
jgi:hypothetical protein